MPDPSIVQVSETFAERLLDSFDRYAREHDLRTARSFGEALEVTGQIRADGGTVALFVSDSRLPDAQILETFGRSTTKWLTTMAQRTYGLFNQ